MASLSHLRLNASDRSYFAILKKEVHALALSAGFGERRLAEADLVVAELVSNLGKHAGGGEVLVKTIEEAGVPGLEIIAVDNGPGIGDLKSMMQDGMSTKNTLGHGLGTIRRLSDSCHIYTQKGWGTIVLARIFNGELAQKRKEPVEVRSLVLPKPGETACGDGFYFRHTRDHLKLFLGDGLGHGTEAALAVQSAIEAFRICPEDNAVEILRFINQSVKKTRGLVATVALFHLREKRWTICGVGNIATKLYSPGSVRNHNAYNGIVGLNMPKSMSEQVFAYEPGQLLVMCSDGMKSKWDIAKFPGIQRHDLSVMNTAIYKDFARNTDDMSVASCKINL